jgi:hypothetical protein
VPGAAACEAAVQPNALKRLYQSCTSLRYRQPSKMALKAARCGFEVVDARHQRTPAKNQKVV